MSGGPTPRERLAVLETLMKNHIHTHDVRDKWLLGIPRVAGVLALVGWGCGVRPSLSI
jgi:hypothetical protein